MAPRMVLLRAAEAGVSPSGHRKLNAGRGDFQVLPAFVIGNEDEVRGQLAGYESLWRWCAAQGLTPPDVLKPAALQS